MESGDDEHASSDDEGEGLKNAYSVNDLLGELSSDDPDHETRDAECTDDNLANNNYVTSEIPADELKTSASIEAEDAEHHTVCYRDGSVPVSGSYSCIYDEVLTEHIYNDPVENGDNHRMTGLCVAYLFAILKIETIDHLPN